MVVKISVPTKKQCIVKKSAYVIRDPSSTSEHTAFIPKNEWIQHNYKDLADQLTTEKKHFTDAVTIIDVDPYIRKLYHSKIHELLLTSDAAARSKILKNYVDEVCKRVDNFSGINLEKLYSYELIFKPSGQSSTAYDYSNNRSIGLHIDTHNVEALEGRAEGFQLLTINLGLEDRYFYFITYEVKDILDKLKSILLPEEIKEISSVKQLKDKFLQNFPMVPVYKLTTKPDQAYIAVTQNLIHDGGTNSQKQQDIALLIGGYFSWK